MTPSATSPHAGIAAQARQIAPVVWLLGKVQAGKTSIVRALTGDAGAAIGSGFRACTTTARVYEFPEDAPLIRFLDTRGLGEVAYDPAEDLAVAEAAAHCIIAVMRAMDTQQDAVVDVLHAVRKRQPGWPIVVAQTHLHEGYQAGAAHVRPYPYRPRRSATDEAAEAAAVPAQLAVRLAEQRRAFQRLPGHGPIAFVPIDFTKAGDGYEPQDYGLEALQDALEWVAPAALAASLSDVARARGRTGAASTHAIIVGHAIAASAADLVPVAAVAAVPAVQAKLLHALAGAHGMAWTRRAAVEFAGALGAGLLTRYAAGFGIRQLVKLIPAYGQTAGAAAAAATSFATTYALGKAAEYFLERRERGEHDKAGVHEAWVRALREAFTLARKRGLGDGDTRPPAAGAGAA